MPKSDQSTCWYGHIRRTARLRHTVLVQNICRCLARPTLTFHRNNRPLNLVEQHGGGRAAPDSHTQQGQKAQGTAEPVERASCLFIVESKH